MLPTSPAQSSTLAARVIGSDTGPSLRVRLPRRELRDRPHTARRSRPGFACRRPL